ncbi:VOC family protein [Gordonia sp. DT30]|uniref:VOC family protein n=1 Tax=unclassified Gordonia (in: high G+C Gram-positive bacteria) TaxID=2657482 RepID=UPI003CF27911
MAPMMFVNLPVADVARSRAFFGGLGFVFDEMFCDPSTLCMPVNRQAMVVMHRRSRFRGYASAPVADLGAGREAVLAISAPSRGAVDRYADAAFGSGATPLRAAEDLGFMYSRSFCDLDGHAWEFVSMDVS